MNLYCQYNVKDISYVHQFIPRSSMSMNRYVAMLMLFHNFQMVRNSKLSTCLAPDFLNLHTRGEFSQQERPLSPINLENALDFIRQRV